MTVGNIVMIVDYQSPHGTWPLARVVKVFLGKDGIMRNVRLKTWIGFYLRSVQKYCLLLESSTPWAA